MIDIASDEKIHQSNHAHETLSIQNEREIDYIVAYAIYFPYTRDAAPVYRLDVEMEGKNN